MLAEILHVGDDVVADLEGAVAAGFRAVLLDRSEENAKKEQSRESESAFARAAYPAGGTGRGAVRIRDLAELRGQVSG